MRRRIQRSFYILQKIKARLHDCVCLFTHAHLLRQMVLNEEERLIERADREVLQIAFRPTGGFGDYIISARLLDELMQYYPCRADVYCMNLAYGKAVYGARPGVTVCYWDSMRYNTLEDSFVPNTYAYDIVMTAEHFTRIHAYNAHRLSQIAPVLMDKVTSLRVGFSEYCPDAGDRNYREALHMHRCELLGINRYTTLRNHHIFKIADHFTYISMDESYLQRVRKLGFSQGRSYITLNRGADSMGKSVLQTKVWSETAYEELIHLFHAAYPEMEIIQLGDKKNSRLAGVDQYVLGEHLETVKWILRGSALHIDCEGGLVHLATQLGTKCVVLFGPTPVHYYGYPENENIVSPVCNNCMGRTKSWAFSCMQGLAKPACLEGITPESVMSHVKKAMMQRPCIQWQPVHQPTWQPWDDVEEEAPVVAVIQPKEDKELARLLSLNYQVVLLAPVFGPENSDIYDVSGYVNQGIDVRLGTEWSLPYPAASCDYAILPEMDKESWTAIEKELWRILKPQGIVVAPDGCKRKG